MFKRTYQTPVGQRKNKEHEKSKILMSLFPAFHGFINRHYLNTQHSELKNISMEYNSQLSAILDLRRALRLMNVDSEPQDTTLKSSIDIHIMCPKGRATLFECSSIGWIYILGGGETRCGAVWLFWIQRAMGSNPVTVMWIW